MNINSYIKVNKNKSFEELPFNYVDGLILSELSYINLDILLYRKDELKLKDIDKSKLNKKVFERSVDASKNKIMLNLMIDAPRYQDLIVRDVERSFSSEEGNQFLAMTIKFPDGRLFLSYRGTDTTLTGWKEDAFLIYKDTILAQDEAIEYALRLLRGKKIPFYLAGHSKGGNLAFYTALNLPSKEAEYLIEAYSYDGPGFKDGIENYPSYHNVINKMVKFRTYNNVIGSFFNNMKKYKVVHSTGLLFGGHDPFYWQVGKDNDFIYKKDISKTSKKYSKRVMNWLESLTYEDRKLATDALFDLFDSSETIYDLFKNFGKDIIHRNERLKDYTEEEKIKLRVIIRRFLAFVFGASSVKEMKKNQEILDNELKSYEKKKIKSLNSKAIE
ncbi:MAG: DUF2974 domain-containing protein [Bacilli bacterium]|nr:DUF2974 domain-containing protein [Bacilli bacterium]